MKINVLVVFLCFSISLASAQKQAYLGVSLNGDMKYGEKIFSGYGLFYEYRFSTHHAVHIGLNQRSEDLFFTQQTYDGSYTTVHMQLDYLSMPVLYKFYSKIVNLSAGVTLDYFASWKDLSKDPNIETSSFTVTPRLGTGIMLRVGKSIPISEKIEFEPELYFNPGLTNSSNYSGLSMKLKYKL